MENNNEVNEDDVVFSQTYIDEFGLYQLDEFKEKHGLVNLLENASPSVIWIARSLYQSF